MPNSPAEMLSWSDLDQLYRESRLSQRQIAQLKHCHPTTVLYHLRSQCIPIRSRHEIVTSNWQALLPEQRQHKLRGLLSLTPEQYRKQAIKGGITRRGAISPSKNVPRSQKDRESISKAVRCAVSNYSPEKKAEINQRRQVAMQGKYYFRLHPDVARQCGIDFWKDPVKASKLIGHKPNKSEIKLAKMLQEHFPGEWRYVGNGKVWLGHRCPDFMNINGHKQLIELFGVHWHNALSAGERSHHFSQFGFTTLVVWEEELKHETQLIRKIKQFSRS